MGWKERSLNMVRGDFGAFRSIPCIYTKCVSGERIRCKYGARVNYSSGFSDASKCTLFIRSAHKSHGSVKHIKVGIHSQTHTHVYTLACGSKACTGGYALVPVYINLCLRSIVGVSKCLGVSAY